MKLSTLFDEHRVTISCELFPPKTGQVLEQAKTVVAEMARLKPAYMSVTYGAGGTAGQGTVEMAEEIQQVNGVPALAHLTCIGASTERVDGVLAALRERGIANILALRGDRPRDSAEGALPTGDFPHASDLIAHICAAGDFCVGGACYPEGHPESPSLDSDIDALKRKVEAGCSFLTTQMFFDNNIVYNFMFRLLRRGVDVPVVAGIMPVTNARQITRICALSGTALPPRFRAIVDRFADRPAAMKQAGIAYATEQIIDLIANGVHHVHIYTMNQPDIAGCILHNLSEIGNS